MIAAAPSSIAGKARTTISGWARPWPAIVLAVLLLLLVGARFAQPIEDGDIFWHMVYGSQMVDHGSLRVDHSQFSWMPASNELIYCAWTGELLFLAVWKSVGIAGLFALRYAAVLSILALMATYAHRQQLLARPETWLVLLVTMLASVVATMPKPEMLSLVLWNALVFCWFELLERSSGQVGRRSGYLMPWIYAMPCIVLVWVNTHGAFILAAPFILIATVAAFFLLPRREAWHMVVAAALCAIATAVNPYGLRYPLQLLDTALGRTARPDIAWNNAFQPTLGAAGQYFHLPEFLVWMALAVAAACALRRRGWGVVAVLFLAYAPLYLLYVRSTFLLPAIFGYGVLYLARDARWPRLSPVVACILFLFFAGRSFAQALRQPESGAWMGFGIGYSQPVDEAEYLARGNYGPRIYNTYNAGGYLIWRLFPRYKVMVDARSFPYLAWFDELKQFSLTQDPKEFQAFLDRHPADVALVDFQEERVWRSFMKTPNWRPAFYGPSAAVFVHEDQSKGRVQAADSLQNLRNGRDGARIFDFATAAGDYRTAWSLLDQMQGRLREQVDAADLERMVQYRAGYEALRAGDYPRAWECFAASFRHHQLDGQDATMLLLLRALLKVQANDPRAAVLRAGLARLTQGN